MFGGLDPHSAFLSFNPNWGNIRGGFAPVSAETSFYGVALPLSGWLESITGILSPLGRVSLEQPISGIYSDIKPSLGAGPLESGVFDRPEPVVDTLRLPPVAEEPTYLPTPVAGVEWLPADSEEAPDFGGGFGPGGPFEDKEPTDWSTVVFDDRPIDDMQRGEDVAIDWGQVVSGAIDIAQGQVLGGGTTSFAPTPFAGAGGGQIPAQVTVDTRTGKVTKCRRRRRRRLLTPTDLSDLAALAAVVGKGDALKLAVAKAVRR